MKKRCRQYLTVLVAAGALLAPWSSAYCASLSVQEAVDMALENNLLIKIQEKGEETARAILKDARGRNSISLSAGGDISLAKRSSSDRSSTGVGRVGFSLPIYNGGRNAANIDSGNLEVQSSYLRTYREMENVRLSVIKAYYDVLEAQKTVAVRQESVNNYQAHLTNVQQLYSAGSRARIDVLRSSVELSNAKQNLIKAENSKEISLSTLKNLLLLDPNEPLTLTEDFSYREFRPDMDSCLTYAMENRKDLLVDANSLQQKELAIKSAKAGYYPSISLSMGANANHYFTSKNDDDQSVNAGVSISWDIFDSGVTEAAVDRAKAARDIAALTLKKDVNDVDLSVRKAYYNMREAEKRFSSTQAAVGQAEEDYFISREKYRAGEGLMLDIIDAQLALSTAKLNYISAQYDYARYKATVENEIGLGVGENVETVLPVEVSAADTKFMEENKRAAANLIPEQVLPDADFTLPKRVTYTNNNATAGEPVNNSSEEAITTTAVNEVEQNGNEQ